MAAGCAAGPWVLRSPECEMVVCVVLVVEVIVLKRLAPQKVMCREGGANRGKGTGHRRNSWAVLRRDPPNCIQVVVVPVALPATGARGGWCVA